MNYFSIHKKYLLAGLGFIFIYFIPYFILGEGSFIRIHDNLDGEVIYRMLLALPHGEVFPQIMNGLPASAMLSPHNFLVFLFKVFTPFTAYIFNEIIAKLVGFLGMYLVLTRYFLSEDDKLISAGSALCFALIPFSNIFSGLTIAGQPLLLFLFLNLLKDKPHCLNYIGILTFAFYSSFVISGIFIILALGLFWLLTSVRQKQHHLPFLLGLVTLGLGYIFVEYKLIMSFIFTDEFVSHRVEMTLPEPQSSDVLKSMFSLLVSNHYHTGHTPTIFILVLVGFAAYKNRLKSIEIKTAMVIILTIVSFFGMFQYIKFYLGDEINILKAFQWNRFYFLLPTIWLVVFAISLRAVFKSKQKFLLGSIVIQLAITIGTSQYYLKTIKGPVASQGKFPSFEQFYAMDLFEEIDRIINKEKSDFRIASLGLHPAVSQYNGFFTLDGYITNYPISYKNDFKNIIQGELDLDPSLDSYFKSWGNRCYLFSHELGKKYIFHKSKEESIKEFALNITAFKSMGGEYLISALPIEKPEEHLLQFVKSFESQKSFYKLHLYKAINVDDS